jgi:hypothetical protein
MESAPELTDRLVIMLICPLRPCQVHPGLSGVHPRGGGNTRNGDRAHPLRPTPAPPGPMAGTLQNFPQVV